MLTLTDMFCGAGGSSTGAVEVPGIEVRTALNHWDRAIETHNTNHPDADHILADIKETDPRYVRRSDILWASPECTNHSVAKGKKRASAENLLQGELWGDDKPLSSEAAERSRATMWDVPRFAEVHKYRAIITENVVDAARWVMFPAWLQAMELLGYDHHTVWLNSMHAQQRGLPAPQSRDRMYVVFWRKGDPRPDIESVTRPVAWCDDHGEVRAIQSWKKGQPWGRYRAQYVYRCPRIECRNRVVEPAWLPASTAIDWDLPAERIGDRARPLSAKTLGRIREGLRRHGGPLHIEAGGNQYDSMDPKHPQHGSPTGYLRAWPTSDPLRTLHTAGTKGIVLDAVHGAPSIAPVEGVLRTQTTSYTRSLLMPYYGASQSATPVTRAMGTVTTVDRYALVDPATSKGREVTEEQVLASRFRMLEPEEYARGMAFPVEYQMLGTKRERVKLAGNAVTPPAARDLIGAVADALNGTWP